MATVAMAICAIVFGLGLLKILYVWLGQLKESMTSNAPSPGLPLPLLGHSYLFFNVAPHEVLDLFYRFVGYDQLKRKVWLFLLHVSKTVMMIPILPRTSIHF